MYTKILLLLAALCAVWCAEVSAAVAAPNEPADRRQFYLTLYNSGYEGIDVEPEATYVTPRDRGAISSHRMLRQSRARGREAAEGGIRDAGESRGSFGTGSRDPETRRGAAAVTVGLPGAPGAPGGPPPGPGGSPPGPGGGPGGPPPGPGGPGEGSPPGAYGSRAGLDRASARIGFGGSSAQAEKVREEGVSNARGNIADTRSRFSGLFGR